MQNRPRKRGHTGWGGTHWAEAALFAGSGGVVTGMELQGGLRVPLLLSDMVRAFMFTLVRPHLAV